VSPWFRQSKAQLGLDCNGAGRSVASRPGVLPNAEAVSADPVQDAARDTLRGAGSDSGTGVIRPRSSRSGRETRAAVAPRGGTA